MSGAVAGRYWRMIGAVVLQVGEGLAQISMRLFNSSIPKAEIDKPWPLTRTLSPENLFQQSGVDFGVPDGFIMIHLEAAPGV